MRQSPRRIVRRGALPVALALLAGAAHAQPAEAPSDPAGIRPLLIGAAAPEATVRDIEGRSLPLTELLKEKRSILVFYRGGW